MSHPQVSAPARRRGFPALVAALATALVSGGCSPSGTGTVAVKDRGKIREALEKGAKAPDPGGKGDDLGIKFRGKSKTD